MNADPPYPPGAGAEAAALRRATIALGLAIATVAGRDLPDEFEKDDYKILVVALDDRRLNSTQRAALEQIGRQLYEAKGKR